MIIEKHPINEEAIEEVYDFYKLEEVTLADGSTGQIKKKVLTTKRSQLLEKKENLNKEILEIDEKINAIDTLK